MPPTTPTNAERMPELREIVEALEVIEEKANCQMPNCRGAQRLAAGLASDLTHLLNQEPWVRGAKIVPQSTYDALVGALKELMGQVNNIEVLGEYSATDMNLKAQRRMRESIDATMAKCRAALVAPQPDTEESDHEQATRERKGGVRS